MENLKQAFELLQRQYNALHFDIHRLNDMRAKGANGMLKRIAKQEDRKAKLKTALTSIALILEDYD